MAVVMNNMDLNFRHEEHGLPNETEVSMPGTNFAQALHDKYVDQEDIGNQFIIPKDKSISTDITLVGFGKVSNIQKQLRNLTCIDLSCKGIVSAGNVDDLEGCLNKVTLLNLAENRLSWHEIIKILSSLPNLKEIVITANNLKSVDPGTTFPNKLFGKLRSLTLGRVELDWNSFVSIVSQIWTSIEQIDMWDSNLDYKKMILTSPNNFTEKILHLTLSWNNFHNIDWITCIGQLNNLTELDLSQCRLESLLVNAAIASRLRNLATLNISHNNLGSWTDISSLYFMENLSILLCNDNPFFNSEKLARSLVIARLAKLKLLNREPITGKNRRDSEILYLRKTYVEYKAYKNGVNHDFNKMHPRYEDIIELYGLPEGLDEGKVVEKYVTVNLCHGGRRITKKFPCDMRVSNLQMLCKRLFQIRPSCPIEIWCDATEENQNPLSYPLDKDGQTLHFFSVKNNYNLSIKSGD